jgi:hypothetical protein
LGLAGFGSSGFGFVGFGFAGLGFVGFGFAGFGRTGLGARFFRSGFVGSEAAAGSESPADGGCAPAAALRDAGFSLAAARRRSPALRARVVRRAFAARVLARRADSADLPATNGTLVSSTTDGSGGIASGRTTGSPALVQSHAEPVTAPAAIATFAETASTMRRRLIIATSAGRAVRRRASA